MLLLDKLLSALDERTIAQEVGLKYDEARMSYPLSKNTVDNFEEFIQIISDYVNHQYSLCISNGGSLSPVEAEGIAKRLINEAYRRTGGSLVTAYSDCSEGLNGGLRNTCDLICERSKAEAVEHYVEFVFDHHIDPLEWDQKVEVIKELLDRSMTHLFGSIDASRPERYASDYKDLIRSFVDSLNKTSSIFMRL